MIDIECGSFVLKYGIPTKLFLNKKDPYFLSAKQTTKLIQSGTFVLNHVIFMFQNGGLITPEHKYDTIQEKGSGVEEFLVCKSKLISHPCHGR